MVEIRYREFWQYVNDVAGYTKKIPEAVFAFTLEEIEALESWVPLSDGFHQEIVDAKVELKKLTPLFSKGGMRWIYMNKL